MDMSPRCTCVGYPFPASSDRCHCAATRPGARTLSPLPFLFSFMDSSAVEFEAGNRILDGAPRLIATAISGALTGLFALAGAFTGAITGALASRAADCGILRGAGLGAIAGAVLSMEVLKASRAYWCLEQSGSRGPSSMADFLEELLRGRLIDDQLGSALLSAYNWQVRVANISMNENVSFIYGEEVSGGLSGDSLKKLPCYMLDEIKESQPSCCTICLQDIEVGEITRTLPRCDHTFHLTCVDKWLVRHGSCHICRQYVFLMLRIVPSFFSPKKKSS